LQMFIDELIEHDMATSSIYGYDTRQNNIQINSDVRWNKYDHEDQPFESIFQ